MEKSPGLFFRIYRFWVLCDGSVVLSAPICSFVSPVSTCLDSWRGATMNVILFEFLVGAVVQEVAPRAALVHCGAGPCHARIVTSTRNTHRRAPPVSLSLVLPQFSSTRPAEIQWLLFCVGSTWLCLGLCCQTLPVFSVSPRHQTSSDCHHGLGILRWGTTAGNVMLVYTIFQNAVATARHIFSGFSLLFLWISLSLCFSPVSRLEDR